MLGTSMLLRVRDIFTSLIPLCDSTLIASKQQSTHVVVCVFPPLQSKVVYTSSSTSFGSYISDKKIGYHFHILVKTYLCMIHEWQETVSILKIGFVQHNRRFGLDPEKMFSFLLMSTTINLFLYEWNAHYNQLDQISIIFMGGLIKRCITIIIHIKLNWLILFFITLFTSIQTPIIIG